MITRTFTQRLHAHAMLGRAKHALRARRYARTRAGHVPPGRTGTGR